MFCLIKDYILKTSDRDKTLPFQPKQDLNVEIYHRCLWFKYISGTPYQLFYPIILLFYLFFCIRSVDVSFKAKLIYSVYYFIGTYTGLMVLNYISCLGCIFGSITDTILTVGVTGWHCSMGVKQMLVIPRKLANEERMLT